MDGYTLKLDLSQYEMSVLAELLRNDVRRAEREGTTGSPWCGAVSKILNDVYEYTASVAEERKL